MGYTLNLPSGNTAQITASATFGDILIAVLLVAVLCLQLIQVIEISLRR